jgi:hypothetical protein
MASSGSKHNAYSSKKFLRTGSEHSQIEDAGRNQGPSPNLPAQSRRASHHTCKALLGEGLPEQGQSVLGIGAARADNVCNSGRSGFAFSASS